MYNRGTPAVKVLNLVRIMALSLTTLHLTPRTGLITLHSRPAETFDNKKQKSNRLWIGLSLNAAKPYRLLSCSQFLHRNRSCIQLNTRTR